MVYTKPNWCGIVPRGYTSPVRDDASAQTRRALINATLGLMRGESGSSFSIDQVAKAAGVTRLTAYNQFGSRRGLLEAVFDDRARNGGLDHMPEAMAATDPREGLRHLVQLFCRFWQSDPALFLLVAEGSSDPDFGASLAQRDVRRRKAIGVLLSRMPGIESLGSRAVDELADLLTEMTGSTMFRTVSANRSAQAATEILGFACDALVSAWIADLP